MHRGWWPEEGESGPKLAPTLPANETPVIVSCGAASSLGLQQAVEQEPQLEPYNAWEELEWTESTIMADIPSSQAWPVGEGQALCASMGGGQQAEASVFGSGFMGGGEQAAAATVFGSGVMAASASNMPPEPMDQGEAAAGPSVGSVGAAGAAGGLLHAAVFLTGGWDGMGTWKSRRAWYDEECRAAHMHRCSVCMRHAWLFCVVIQTHAVRHSDPSRELLLQMVPPLHPKVRSGDAALAPHGEIGGCRPCTPW